jgi:hypothetical protein
MGGYGMAAFGAKRTLALDAKSKAACSARLILERGWHLEAEAMGSQRIDSTLNLDKIWVIAQYMSICSDLD